MSLVPVTVLMLTLKCRPGVTVTATATLMLAVASLAFGKMGECLNCVDQLCGVAAIRPCCA